MKKNWKKLLFTSFIALLLFSGVAYLARGWIRTTLIPSYASTFYKPHLDKVFAATFSPVNEKLNTYKIEFLPPFQDECWSDGNLFFEGFKETVPCIKDQQSKDFTITEDFISDWQRTSPNFEQYLLSTGWQKIHYEEQPIGGIFSVQGYEGTIAVNYSKSSGKVECDLSLSYDPEQSFWAFESCQRNVVFFGGY